ncbi:MAG: trypsin-like peptidase domain-containing protein [Eubacteriales bacterium]
MPNLKRNLIFIALAAFVAGVMFMSGCLFANDLPLFAQSKGSLAVNTADASSAGLMSSEVVANIVSSAGPAVVKIDTYTTRSVYVDPFFNDPFFRQFFGSPYGQSQTQEEHGLGSGFIFSSNGYILTNDHVINGADRIKVTIQGYKNPLLATVVGEDYDLDLAVLKVQAKNLPMLKLGDSNVTRVGNWVIAIGNPYGLDHTVTVGVISAKERPISAENRKYKNLLQTDASINPGNSGGPLLNLAGEVIGINTAVAQAQGIGFAIPSKTANEVILGLISKGKVVKP